MENIVKKLFEAGLLSEADQNSLQEAFDARITEAQALVETQVREEMSQRYENDKNALVEALDGMLTDVVQKYESSKGEEAAKLKEAQAKFESAKTELKSAYKTRVKEHAQVLETFVLNKLSSELGEFAEDKNAVSEMRVKYATAIAECKNEYKAKMSQNIALMRKFVVEKLEAELASLREQQDALTAQKATFVKESAQARKALQEQYASRIAKMDKFVVTKVASELKEFAQDKQALVDKKVQLVAEAREKIAETQRTFIKAAAKLVDQKVTETMKVELKQLHEDLERNRQNMFGRRIFEAIASEYMSSYFSEGTEVKKLEKVLESKDAELAKAKQLLQESKLAIDTASRKARLAEDNASRTKVMSELLAPLARDKRTVMQELLESVKTPALKDAFHKYLPAVLNEGSRKTAPQSRQTLSEAPVRGKSTVAITGDQRNNRLQETVQADTHEDVVSQETATILKLAGIKK